MNRYLIRTMNYNSSLSLLKLQDKNITERNIYFKKLIQSYWIKFPRDYRSLCHALRIYDYLTSLHPDLPTNYINIFFYVADNFESIHDNKLICSIPNFFSDMSKIIVYPPTIYDYLIFFSMIVPLTVEEEKKLDNIHLSILPNYVVHHVPASILAVIILNIVTDCDVEYLIREYCQESVDPYIGILAKYLPDYIIPRIKLNTFIGPSYEPDIKGLKINEIDVLKEVPNLGCKIGFGTYGDIYTLDNNLSLVFKEFKDDSMLIEFLNLINLNNPCINQILCIDKYNINRLYFDKGDVDLHRYIMLTDKVDKKLIKSYMVQLVTVIHYCHSNLLAHNDLKANNIIIYKNGLIKLIDFGTMTRYTPGELLPNHRSTTYIYASPEVRDDDKKIDFATNDMWSLGIIFLFMLTKSYPLFDPDIFNCDLKLEPIYESINKRVLDNSWDSIIPDITKLEADFLCRLLTFQPNKRITSSEAINHAYITH